MKPVPKGRGVSKSRHDNAGRGRGWSNVPDLITRWNNCLNISSSIQGQQIILQFMSRSSSGLIPAVVNAQAHIEAQVAVVQTNPISHNEEVDMETPAAPSQLSSQPVSHEPNLLRTTQDSTQHTCMVLPKAKVVFEEEQLSLLDRVDPIIPGPLLHSDGEYQDADGWSQIDQLSIMDCVLCPFQAVEDVPNQYRELFGRAMNKILTRIWENQEEGDELNRALKWWFLISQALLRKAVRGGKAGMGQIKKRFDCVLKENYGDLWRSDNYAVTG